MQVALIAHRATRTNLGLAAARWRGRRVAVAAPAEAVLSLEPGDVAVGRLDVRGTLDGVEAGLWELEFLARAGVRVLNSPQALLAAHDKLLTALILDSAGIPHPRTQLVCASDPEIWLEPPLVIKPRFGSRGRDVFRCRDAGEVREVLEIVRERPWFQIGGIAQELLPTLGRDIRLVVAGGRVIGATRRVAASTEWRTNVALGGRRERLTAPARAFELALAAAEAADLDLVGVDLLPTGPGRFTVLELNGAVDFNDDYRLIGDPFRLAMASLARRRALAPGVGSRAGRLTIPLPDVHEIETRSSLVLRETESR